MSGFHGAFATGVASQQGTLTLPDTWFRPPFWDLLMLQLLRPNSSNLPCLYSTFHLEHPLVLSRFSFVESVWNWDVWTMVLRIRQRRVVDYVKNTQNHTYLKVYIVTKHSVNYSYFFNILCGIRVTISTYIMRKRRRSDPVLWQNPLYQQKIRKPKDNTHKRHQKLRLHNDCGPTKDGQLE